MIKIPYFFKLAELKNILKSDNDGSKNSVSHFVSLASGWINIK